MGAWFFWVRRRGSLPTVSESIRESVSESIFECGGGGGEAAAAAAEGRRCGRGIGVAVACVGWGVGAYSCLESVHVNIRFLLSVSSLYPIMALY